MREVKKIADYFPSEARVVLDLFGNSSDFYELMTVEDKIYYNTKEEDLGPIKSKTDCEIECSHMHFSEMLYLTDQMGIDDLVLAVIPKREKYWNTIQEDLLFKCLKDIHYKEIPFAVITDVNSVNANIWGQVFIMEEVIFKEKKYLLITNLIEKENLQYAQR
jgi:hypothetical protein